MPPTDNTSIGIAFQGGSFLAGAIGTGVIRKLVGYQDGQVFRRVRAFSGTSAGALVAALCWREALNPTPRHQALVQGLEKFWLKFANGSIPHQEAGDFWKSFDQIARLNPAYDAMADSLRIPMIQGMFREWISEGIRPAEVISQFCGGTADSLPVRLAMGAAGMLHGDVVTFIDQDFIDAAADGVAGTGSNWSKREQVVPDLDLTGLREALSQASSVSQAEKRAVRAGGDLMLSALMASGSLDEVNGKTRIDSGPYDDIYLDGAWGQNPPIDVMIDMGVKEIWIVRVFPKACDREPATYHGRADRKEELWQNAMVEQQIRTIDKINSWIKKGYFTEDAKKRHIDIYAIDMDLDVTPGARVVNDKAYLKAMMKHGAVKMSAFLRTPERYKVTR